MITVNILVAAYTDPAIKLPLAYGIRISDGISEVIIRAASEPEASQSARAIIKAIRLSHSGDPIELRPKAAFNLNGHTQSLSPL